MICQSNESYAREIINAQALESNRVEGALVSVSKETHLFAHLQNLEENGIPVVYFDRTPEELEVDRVIIDDKKAAYNATCHLIDTGCKRIAHLTTHQTLGIGVQRLAGYKQALEDHGIPFREDWVIVADSFELAGDATRNLMHLPSPPDAIFAVNDMTAIGAMKTLQRMSIAVPQKVAIIGFSAGSFSDITTPTLSSVDQHGYEMGIEAAKLLLERIEKPVEGKHKTHYIDTHLVIRESSKRKN
jgi:LacI family transcriptional regulator